MAQPTPVQAVSVQSTTSATSVTSPTFNSTSGNLLAVVWGDGTGATYGANPISDNKTNTWASAVARATATSCACAQQYAKNITGGSGHTVTLTATTADFIAVAVEEISGADTVAPLDQSPAATTSAGSLNPHNAASITPTQANTLAVAGITENAINNNTVTATGTATVRTSQTSAAGQPIALSTDGLSTAAAVTEGFNLAPNDSVNHVVVVANFIGAASAATPGTVTYAYNPN